ncbi:MAG: chemotaxis protein CheW [Gammaproteobacteria bacterium]|nr:chemotaxis protein CheW [Gammaproteobacteria bacterium]MBU2478030.1 chemotaxis protein CheW [Gammaproteobacteria bacterium]
MNDKAVKTETRSAQLVMLDQQLALGAYLQALLRPVPLEVAESVADPVAAPPAEIPRIVRETVPLPKPVAVVNEEPVAEITPQPAPAAYPEWAQGQFQCLMFQVAGLTLALPLAKLYGVLPWDAELVTELPNHQPWFLGLRTHLDHKVKLIDVANVVLPADRRASLPAATSGRLGKVILIDEGRWGLACDDVAEVITLSNGDVKWRSQSGTRPWLAGTVIQQMCVLIDTEAFATMLLESGPASG